MAYNIQKGKINIKRKGNLKKVDNKNPHHKAALKYNHVRVQLFNGDEKHLLFTDHQIKRGKYRAKTNPEDLPAKGWYSDYIISLFETGLADMQLTPNWEKNPAAAKYYNHIIVYVDKKPMHLLFTDNDIKVALKRAGRNPEDLPQVSWIYDLVD